MMNDISPRVLVIIVNYRTPQMSLRAATAALADLPQGAELVIVDNGSQDGSADILQGEISARGWDAEGRVRLIRSQVNGGFGAGNNQGFAANMSDGRAPEFFYLLNSDALPDRGCLPQLLRHLVITPKAGIVGSHVRGEDGAEHITAFRFPSIAGEFEGAARTGPITRLLRRAVVAPPLPQGSAQVDWVAGASVLLRAQMLREIGLFDERFFLYFEETDLCKRAAQGEWQCWYLPCARAVHIGSVSTGMKNWQRVPAYWHQSRSHYFIKNHGRLYAAAALAARLAGGAVHSARAMLAGKPRQDPPGFYRDLLRFGLGLSGPKPCDLPRPRHSEENI